MASKPPAPSSPTPAYDTVRVVMLTTFDYDDHLFAALHAGASGYLLKDLDGAELVRAVRTVAAGSALLDPAITARVLVELTSALGARARSTPDGCRSSPHANETSWRAWPRASPTRTSPGRW